MPDHMRELYNVLHSINKMEEVGPDTSDEGENAQSLETTGEEELQPKVTSSDKETGPKPTPFTMKSMFSYGVSHPVLLDLVLFRKFGPTWLEWEPETIWSEIKDEFGATSISVLVRNKINAVKLLHIMDTPWTEWEVFSAVAQTFNDNICDFRVLQKLSPDHIIASINIMSKIKDLKFSEEVGRFITACFLDDGIFYLPPPVQFAQIYASEPQYICKNCGNIDTDEDNNVCDVCGAPQSFLEYRLKRDYRPVEERFNKVLEDGARRKYALEENMVDVQVAKLLRAYSWSQELDRRLKEQGMADG
jgi:hypothetical protein